MNRVLAAIDSSAAARTVLSAAGAMARLLGADVDALHVREGGWESARAAAEAAGVALTIAEGPTLPTILEHAAAPDVQAVVVGARRTPGGSRPAGHVAMHVATSVRKPIVVVPPDSPYPVQLQRLLVPLEPVIATATALESIIDAACSAGADVIALHVVSEGLLPLFTDQPQHEVEAWIDEFLLRYCHRDRVSLESRVGVPAEHALAVAGEVRADALVLGWSQRLIPGRAVLVRAALERSAIPLILVPLSAVVEVRAKPDHKPA
jgi:nucleotide-binding universal stress UspA family protein